eukprot:5751734-Ditylum_brightwellii.AAC.1
MNATDLGVCLVCSSKHETWMYLYRCNDADSVTIRTLAITKFQATLLKCKTAPIICDVLTYKLSQWMHLVMGNTPSVHCNNLGHNLSLALEEQANISWENFVKGRVSEWWGKSQQMFYNYVYPSSNYEKEQWTRQLITGVWQFFNNVSKARNAHLHSPLGTDNKSHLNKRIRYEYSTLSHAMSWTGKHDFTVINKGTPFQPTITKMFQAQETEQVMTT